MGARTEFQERRLQACIVAGGIGPLGKHPHDLAGADDMDVENRDLVAGAPVAHDPGGGLGPDARQAAQGVPELQVRQVRLRDLPQALERSGQVLRALAREAVAHRPAADGEGLEQQALAGVMGQEPVCGVSEGMADALGCGQADLGRRAVAAEQTDDHLLDQRLAQLEGGRGRIAAHPSLADPEGRRERVVEAPPADAGHQPLVRVGKVEGGVLAGDFGDNPLHVERSYAMHIEYANWASKSTVSTELLQQVRERMSALRLTQEGVAKACRLSQPHLSKVLSGKIAPGRKTKLVLERWLARASPEASGGEAEELARIIYELLATRPERRMQIMQLLRLIRTLAQ